MLRKVVITGASRGIGREVALTLLNEGHTILGLSRTHSIEHDHYFGYPLDLSDIQSLPTTAASIVVDHPDIDTLICNAGIWHNCLFEDLSSEQMIEMIHLNLLAPALLSRAILPRMKDKRPGNIIFIGSTAGLIGKPFQSLYCASKSGLRALAQSLRAEYASSQIRITIINPGAALTGMLSMGCDALAEDPLLHILPKDIADLVDHLINGRVGTVFDEVTLSPQMKISDLITELR